jgi:hypothetical protein
LPDYKHGLLKPIVAVILLWEEAKTQKWFFFVCKAARLQLSNAPKKMCYVTFMIEPNPTPFQDLFLLI